MDPNQGTLKFLDGRILIGIKRIFFAYFEMWELRSGKKGIEGK